MSEVHGALYSFEHVSLPYEQVANIAVAKSALANIVVLIINYNQVYYN